jgi:hypothetical protein
MRVTPRPVTDSLGVLYFEARVRGAAVNLSGVALNALQAVQSPEPGCARRRHNAGSA